MTDVIDFAKSIDLHLLTVYKGFENQWIIYSFHGED